MQALCAAHSRVSSFREAVWRDRVLISLLVLCALLMTGCGGGYAGSGITTLSASKVTIDAGQSFSVTAQSTGTIPLTWALTGASCTGSACGAVAPNGATAVYTAPASLTTPIVVTLTASVPYTQNSSTTTITVNPAPTITGSTPAGTVGTAYSATLVAAGGTGTLKLSLSSGTLPAGLSFNATTGVISGTPTANGASNFTVQAVDQSDVPDTVTASRQITIGAAVLPLTASGTPPAGTVGVAYTYTLSQGGGTAPYTWTVASGTLPTGLTLSSTGTISGTPTTAGTFTATAQVQDAASNKATLPISISIPLQGPF